MKVEDVFDNARKLFIAETPDRFMEALFSRKNDLLALNRDLQKLLSDNFYNLITIQLSIPKLLEVWKCMRTDHQLMTLCLLAANSNIMMGIKENDFKLISHYFT